MDSDKDITLSYDWLLAQDMNWLLEQELPLQIRCCLAVSASVLRAAAQRASASAGPHPQLAFCLQTTWHQPWQAPALALQLQDVFVYWWLLVM